MVLHETLLDEKRADLALPTTQFVVVIEGGVCTEVRFRKGAAVPYVLLDLDDLREEAGAADMAGLYDALTRWYPEEA